MIKAGSDDTPGTGDDFTNLIAQFQGVYVYSYTFDGQVGYLDHALANASLLPQITGAADWHINTDEPDVLDYDVGACPQTLSEAAVEAMRLKNGGLILGVDPTFTYHTSSHTMRDGDVIVCDTDGMKEATDRRGRMYGAERLSRVVASYHGESAEEIHGRIFRDVESFVAGGPQADDMTLVVGRVSNRPALS